ncbi:hypothetical protein SAMN05216226_102313 [Halovenus aranensis]|uniref:MarR family protein n=1 Tax=Halovenus aranensis TaxID=890420 RepID=A0A1G8T6E4_9EURY|nr:DUF6432 family protein [Halovenus aranensis]SDJ36250.1 hypothetical protein SAMN05216226_102313 [Halovenus aranensis]
MMLKPEYRDRDETDVVVLGTLAERPEDGMTIFELRAAVEEDIDSIETSLSRLKRDDLIRVDQDRGQTVVVPQEHVLTNGTGDDTDPDTVDRIRDWFPF